MYKKVLLDTNIVIHRENNIVSNSNIGNLFYWLDKLHCLKFVHPLTIEEINNYDSDKERLKVLQVKLKSYETLKTSNICDKIFLDKVSPIDETPNGQIDNKLLYEVYIGSVDILITEDKKLREKAKACEIRNKVFSINEFICKVTEEHPSLIQYQTLAVKKIYFGDVNLESNFFDSFRRDYKEFDSWFRRKSNDEAYICKDDKDNIQGFLYLKIEGENENYNNIQPIFIPKKRLKVGTFKVVSTGFRLGERFIKIIFDNAIEQNVDEIYVTLFDNKPEITALSDLLQKWGFIKYGKKITENGEELVLIKPMKEYNISLSAKENFPNILYNKQKFILPIRPEFHTRLLPDSKLKNENLVNFVGKDAHKYALQKVYISWTIETNINSGDIIVFYRMGEKDSYKKYSSVLTTVGIVDSFLISFKSKEDYLNNCQNRSVFTSQELEYFWNKAKNNVKILKFIFLKSLTKKLNLDYLRKSNIIAQGEGPRPFTKITDEQFDKILQDSNTSINFYR